MTTSPLPSFPCDRLCPICDSYRADADIRCDSLRGPAFYHADCIRSLCSTEALLRKRHPRLHTALITQSH